MLDGSTNNAKTKQLLEQGTTSASERRAHLLNTYGAIGTGDEGQNVAALEEDNENFASGGDADDHDSDRDGIPDNEDDYDNDSVGAIEAERNRFDFARLLSNEVRDATAHFSNLGYGDGAAGRSLAGLDNGAKLIIQAKERATAAAESRATTPDGFLDAKDKEADLALFKARLVEREAGHSGDTKAYQDARAAEDKILQQQQAIASLKNEFAKPGADKSTLLLAAYGSEYEASRRGSTSTLLADGKGISTKADLGKQFEIAASPSTALIPEIPLRPMPTLAYQGTAPDLSKSGGLQSTWQQSQQRVLPIISEATPTATFAAPAPAAPGFGGPGG